MPPIVMLPPSGPTISQREFSKAFRIRIGAKSMTATVVNLRQGRFLFTARHGIENYPQDSIELFGTGRGIKSMSTPSKTPILITTSLLLASPTHRLTNRSTNCL